MNNPVDFFTSNVDSWGAREWWGRLRRAVAEHDRAIVEACVAADETVRTSSDAMATTYRSIVTSSAFRLARDHGEEISDMARRIQLYVEALAEIKATVDGDSDQSVKDIVYGLLEELK